MKKSILLFFFTLFIIHYVSAQKVNFIGKWVNTKTEFYTNDNLVDAEESNQNEECIEYVEFLSGGKTRTKEYFSDCDAKDPTLGTYEYENGLWKLSADGESYKAKIRINNDALQMIVKMPDEDGMRKEVIAYFVKYDRFSQKTTPVENTNQSYCEKIQEEQNIRYQYRVEQRMISKAKSAEILTLIKLLCENTSKEEFQKLLKPASAEDYETINNNVRNLMQSNYEEDDVNYVMKELIKKYTMAEEEKQHKLDLLYDIDIYLKEVGIK